MIGRKFISIAIALAAGSASADNCGGWMKARTSLSGLYCTTSAKAAATCQTCCIADTTKCGANSASYTCDAGKVKDTAKANNAAGSDAAAMKTNCCTARAKCSTYTCAAGKKLKANAATTNCLNTACAAADASTCCENDATKCLGTTVTCDAGKYKDALKSGAAAGANAAEHKTNCCTAKAKCSTYTCAAGSKLKTNNANIDCATKTCGNGDWGTCCENDATKCKGTTVTCDAGTYKDALKNGATAGANAAEHKTNCCTAKAKCSTYTCAAGTKLKTNNANINCATKTCGNGDAGTCCENDTTKCKWKTLTCAAGFYRDASKANNAAGAALADWKSNCCTAKATCSSFFATSTGTSSGAWKPQAVAANVMFAMAGAMALSQ